MFRKSVEKIELFKNLIRITGALREDQ